MTINENQKTMTVKEIAELTGKNKSTVGRWIVKAGCKMQQLKCKVQQGSPQNPANFNLDETIAIIRAGDNNVLADLLMENANRTLSNDKVAASPNGEVLSEVMDRFDTILEKQYAFFREITDKIMDFSVGRSKRARAVPLKTPAKEIGSPRQAFEAAVRKMAISRGVPFQDAHMQVYRDLNSEDNFNYIEEAATRGVKVIELLEDRCLLMRCTKIAMDYIAVGEN